LSYVYEFGGKDEKGCFVSIYFRVPLKGAVSVSARSAKWAAGVPNSQRKTR